MGVAQNPELWMWTTKQFVLSCSRKENTAQWSTRCPRVKATEENYLAETLPGGLLDCIAQRASQGKRNSLSLFQEQRAVLLCTEECISSAASPAHAKIIRTLEELRRTSRSSRREDARLDSGRRPLFHQCSLRNQGRVHGNFLEWLRACKHRFQPLPLFFHYFFCCLLEQNASR